MKHVFDNKFWHFCTVYPPLWYPYLENHIQFCQNENDSFLTAILSLRTLKILYFIFFTFKSGNINSKGYSTEPSVFFLDYFSFLINLRYSLCKILSICDNLAHPSHSFTYSRHTQGHMWVPNQLWRSAALPERFIWSAGCLGAFQSWKSSSSSHGSTWEGLKVRGHTDEQH